MTRGQHAVLIVAALAAAAVSSVSAQSVAPTLACVAPPGFARFDTPLERVAARISAHQPLTIVAIGSSSTFGLGASSPAMSYPSQLAVELRALLPSTSITVINRGVNGETAREMLARFDRDVFAAHPDLVLWQVGSNAVLLGRPIAPTGLLIDEGVRRLKAAGSDVVLIDGFARTATRRSEGSMSLSNSTLFPAVSAAMLEKPVTFRRGAPGSAPSRCRSGRRQLP
jgi:acyl-CoA thioesterase I